MTEPRIYHKQCDGYHKSAKDVKSCTVIKPVADTPANKKLKEMRLLKEKYPNAMNHKDPVKPTGKKKALPKPAPTYQGESWSIGRKNLSIGLGPSIGTKPNEIVQYVGRCSCGFTKTHPSIAFLKTELNNHASARK